MGQFIRRIRKRRVQQRWGEDTTYQVQVPNEWAERMLADGRTHVQIKATPVGGELVLTALHEEDVKQWRLQTRQAANRERARQRYQA
jgi:hypothetical protein